MITIYTGKPNYPDGNLYPNYKRSGIQEEDYQGIDIYRVPLRPRNNSSTKNLILNYCSFVWSGLIHSVKLSRKKQFDAILVYGLSPITAAIPGVFLKWLTKSHLALWIQDLWPQSVQATGFIKNRHLLKGIEILVRGIYYFSDTLLVQSHAFIPSVARLTANQNKIIYYPNSSLDILKEDNNIDSLSPEFITLLENNFCIVFAGNIGTAQAVETIVEAAEKLKHLSDIKLVLVGSGSMAQWIEQQIVTRGLDNLILPGRFPISEMPGIYSRAAGLLVTLKRDEIFTYTIPCKVQSYLSAGRPVIAAIDGEGARVVRDSGAGLASPAEDPTALAQSIEELYHMPIIKREEMGTLGHSYFLQHFEITSQSHRLIAILQEQISNGNKYI